jgi:hypothetical protein
LNQHLDKTKKSLKKSSFIWRLPGPPVKSIACLVRVTASAFSEAPQLSPQKRLSFVLAWCVIRCQWQPRQIADSLDDGAPYLRTYADGVWNDNLLSLNQCPLVLLMCQ